MMTRIPLVDVLSLRQLRAVTVALLLLILFFGLRFKGYDIINGVSWVAGQNGLRFQQNGIVYSDPKGRWLSCQKNPDCPISLEFAITPNRAVDGRFKIIMALHAGRDSDQLIVGQWRSSLIVMNGDDYNGRRGVPRIGIKTALPQDTARFVAITSDRGGTAIFLDGEKVKWNQKLVLRIPENDTGGRLVVGNSVYGRHAWEGVFSGLAVYDRILDAQQIAAHFGQWRRTSSFAAFASDHPRRLYAFDEGGGSRVNDLSGGNRHLMVPTKMRVLEKEWLVPPRRTDPANPSLVPDITLNLLGFVPLGFFLGLLNRKSGGARERRWLALTILSCFLISLSIEIAQAWIPSRSSQLMDLILNTAGAVVGVMILKYALSFFEKRQQRKPLK